MLTKLKQYAKGVAYVLASAGTVAVSSLPDGTPRLVAEIAVASAGLIAVVTVRNAKPADEIDAAETLIARLSAVPALAKYDAILVQIGALLAKLDTGAVRVSEDTGTHVVPDPDPVVPVLARVVDASVVPVADPPADPVVAAVLPEIPAPPVPPVGPPAPVEVDLTTTLPDDVAPPTVGSFTTD